MTEFELITLVLERRTELISLMQWWASISVGIIAGAQLLERYLNMIFISILIAFYALFTFATFRLMGAIGQQMGKAFEDLSRLEQPSAQALLMIDQYASGYIGNTESIILAVISIVALATCAYPIWIYKNNAG